MPKKRDLYYNTIFFFVNIFNYKLFVIFFKKKNVL